MLVDFPGWVTKTRACITILASSANGDLPGSAHEPAII